MKSLTFALPLAMLATVSCSQPSPPVIAVVTIETQGYSIEKTHYESASELLAGLKAMPRLDCVGISALPGTGKARLAQTIAAIKSAGITTRIAIVGNEVFSK